MTRAMTMSLVDQGGNGGFGWQGEFMYNAAAGSEVAFDHSANHQIHHPSEVKSCSNR